MQGFELQWNIAKSTVTTAFRSPVKRPNDDFRDFLRAGRLNVRNFSNKTANRCAHGVFGAPFEIPRWNTNLRYVRTRSFNRAHFDLCFLT